MQTYEGRLVHAFRTGVPKLSDIDTLIEEAERLGGHDLTLALLRKRRAAIVAHTYTPWVWPPWPPTLRIRGKIVPITIGPFSDRAL